MQEYIVYQEDDVSGMFTDRTEYQKMLNLAKSGGVDVIVVMKLDRLNRNYANGETAIKLLSVFGLERDAKLLASNLPYGKQRKLEIARALATNPKLLLLDEPAAGMNPNETEELMNTIQFIREEFDISILVIEHDMRLVSGICQQITVLNFGEILAQGETAAVLQNPEVITAYLGE